MVRHRISILLVVIANQLAFWPVAEGRTDESTTLEGHTDWVYCVAISPDSKTIASGSSDATIRLWDIRTMTEIKVIKDDSTIINSLNFVGDGSILVSASMKLRTGGYSGKLQWYNIKKDRLIEKRSFRTQSSELLIAQIAT